MSRRIVVIGLVVVAFIIAVPVVVMISVQRGGAHELEAERANAEVPELRSTV